MDLMESVPEDSVWVAIDKRVFCKRLQHVLSLNANIFPRLSPFDTRTLDPLHLLKMGKVCKLIMQRGMWFLAAVCST